MAGYGGRPLSCAGMVTAREEHHDGRELLQAVVLSVFIIIVLVGLWALLDPTMFPPP